MFLCDYVLFYLLKNRKICYVELEEQLKGISGWFIAPKKSLEGER